MEYELLFFTSVANEDRAPEIKREIEETITGRGGKISKDFFDIGKRKFAHPIKKQTHGFFSFCHFTLEETENLPELTRRIALNDKVMRHIIVRADEVGKPIGAQTVREERTDARAKHVSEPAKSPASPKRDEKETKPAEETSKVGMAELDEKLSEILENPE
ncbi:MAG TPA: 30S ribosomal protein S6 [Candidatus Bathyarchaeia archaeon]|nr:30S ribosomal protein S6 [Candidatus Bathyarchaeia archaeon]